MLLHHHTSGRNDQKFHLDLIREVHTNPKLIYIGYKYFTDKNEAITSLYPNQFQTADIHKRAILASTNECVAEWNTEIQKLNPSEMQTLVSENTFEEADDPNSILRSMLKTTSLEYFNKPGIPDHELKLKENDICFLLSTISRKDNLSRNTRVIRY